MKALTLSLMATFFALVTYGQPITTNAPLGAKPASPMLLSLENTQIASIEKITSYSTSSAYIYREKGDECFRYKKQRTLGIVFASVGGGLFISGIVMVAAGSADIANTNNNNLIYGTVYTAAPVDYVLEGVGATFVVAGVAGMGVGIPFAIIGSVKYHKHCAGGRSQLDIGTNGSNLALKF